MDFWFYGFQLFFLAVYAVMYADFRDAARTALRLSESRKGKSFSERLWWSDRLGEGMPSGLYHLHRIATVVFVTFGVPVLAMGYLAALRIVWVVLISAVSLVIVPLNFYAFIQHNRADYGRAFVWFEKRKHGAGGFRCSVVDVFWSITPLLAVIFDLFFLI